jgi:hypothetical protein
MDTDGNPSTHSGKQRGVGFGFRNNQGFAYAKINGTDHLYGQQHGPSATTKSMRSEEAITAIHW